MSKWVSYYSSQTNSQKPLNLQSSAFWYTLHGNTGKTVMLFTRLTHTLSTCFIIHTDKEHNIEVRAWTINLYLLKNKLKKVFKSNTQWPNTYFVTSAVDVEDYARAISLQQYSLCWTITLIVFTAEAGLWSNSLPQCSSILESLYSGSNKSLLPLSKT